MEVSREEGGTPPQTALERTATRQELLRRALRLRWLGLGLLFLAAFLSFFVRLAPAVAIPNLREAFALNSAQLGLLTSIYLWPFALMQPVVGLLTDSLGPRRTVAGFLLTAAVGQLVFAVAPFFPLALAGRALSGVGFSTLYVSAARIMAEWFRPREFGTLTGLWTSVANVGALTATAPLAAMIAIMGWRGSFGLIGALVLATVALIYLLVRDRPADLGLPSPAELDGQPRPTSPPPAIPLRQGVALVLRERNTWLLGGFAITSFGTMTMMQGFLAVPYLMDVYGKGRQEAANSLTLWAVGLIIGCTLWGYVADRVLGSRKAVVVTGVAAYCLLWLLLALVPSGLPDALLWLAMLWGGLTVSTWIPSYPLLRESLPPQVVGTAMGVLNLFYWLGGALYQLLGGLVLKAAGGEGEVAPVGAYKAVFWLALGSVALAIFLASLTRERRSAPR